VGRDCQEEPVAGTTIPIAKQDRLVKRNYKILDTRDRLTSSLKWLNDYEHNDSDEGDRGELVDHAEKTRRMAIGIGRKILTATNKKKMKSKLRRRKKKKPNRKKKRKTRLAERRNRNSTSLKKKLQRWKQKNPHSQKNWRAASPATPNLLRSGTK